MIVYDKEQKQIVIPNGIGNINLYNNGVEAGYNQGYEQGQADMASNARVLNVTENGIYKSKYSDPFIPTVTGVYADGTDFYNYAELNGKIFNTKIAGSMNSRLEFWYKGDNTKLGDGNNVIIGSGDINNGDYFQVRYYDGNNNTIRIEVGNNTGNIYDWDDTVWHHLIISKAEGIWFDGEHKYTPFPYNGTVNGEFFINGIGFDTSGTNTANGTFGMIKIDDVVIIPTANGFKNVNTGELLEVVKDGGYTYTENVPIYPEGELYKTINVNIDVDSYYNNGYNQGKTDGISEQKSKLKSINITENGTYTKEDGYSHIEVNVPDLNGSYDEGYAEGERVGYGQGKTDGINEQKGKLSQITISENGTYSKEDGYSEVVVNVPDLNGDYNEGYQQGKADGINEQKSKLGSISITENGTYTKEDGYNHIEVNVPDLNGDYNEGYEQGQADVAANARALNVTENGVYRSKFSDPIPPTVTGVYADGTQFYGYAELNGKVFNTKIAATIDSRLEFWYKGDNTVAGDGWNAIIGAGNVDNKDCFQVRYWDHNNDRLLIEIGNSGMNYYNWDDTVWHHLIVSKAEGLWIDGKKEWNFKQPSNTVNGEFLINGTGYNVNSNANGCFGMIKIDDVVIIPTANGFQNVNTGELLQVVNDGGYTFTENLPIYGEGELYKTINVNVVPKVNIKEAGIKFGSSTFTEVPECADFRGITDMSKMFMYCHNLQTIPLIDTSNVTNMNNMFYNCSSLQTIPLINTSKVTNMNQIFYSCSNLQTIPQLDTSNVTDMNNMFYSCDNLSTLPELDVSNLIRIGNYFRNGGSNLTDVGGWKNLKINWNDNFGLKLCPNLTYQSCINVLNGLYDFVGNGSTETRTLKVHPNFLTTVGDEISIGTSRGWVISA